MIATPMALLLAAAPCPVSAQWRDAPPPTGMPVEPARNTVRVEGAALFWNDQPVAFDTLTAYGSALGQMQPRPWLLLDASQADCATLQRTAKALGEAASCDPDNCFVIRKTSRRR